jgi:hypothetical protein
MATLVVFGDPSDGLIESSNATYATAAAGSGLFTDTTTVAGDAVGQAFFTPTYYVMEFFLSFDTSALGSGATVTAADIAIYGSADSSTTDFTIRAAALAWGTLTTADWQNTTALAALTILATWNTATSFSTAAYTTLTDSGGMAASVNKTGNSQYVLWSSRHQASTTPTGAEYVQIHQSDETGTTNDPKITITYTPAAVPPRFLGGGFI